jgi:hypothetical protein
MSQRSSAANGPGGADSAQAPGRGDWADGEWPDDLWPDGDDGPPGEHRGQAGAGTPAAATSPGRAAGALPRPVTLMLIALAAAVAGAGAVLAVRDLSRPSSAAPAPSSQPSGAVGGLPGGSGAPGANGALPGGSAGGRLFVIGTVTAVSRTSITIGGSGHSVTAAVTNSTQITGNVTGIGGIRTGDEVSAQITQSGGKDSADAIQDPAQARAGGGLP